jgi:hypothetical protein
VRVPSGALAFFMVCYARSGMKWSTMPENAQRLAVFGALIWVVTFGWALGYWIVTGHWLPFAAVVLTFAVGGAYLRWIWVKLR